MKLPHRVDLTEDVEDDEIASLIMEWVDKNPDTMHKLVLLGCQKMSEHKKITHVPLVEFVYTTPFDDSDEIVAEIGVDREEALIGLEESKKWFVEIEDYESAAAVVECEKKLKKNK